MQASMKSKDFIAKTATQIENLKKIRHWLMTNCKNRWSATNYKGDPFNWRKLGKIESRDFNGKDWKIVNFTRGITIMVHFKKPEDLMLYLSTWPSEVLLEE